MIDYTKEIGKIYGCYKILEVLPKTGKKVYCLCECQICKTKRKVGYDHLKRRLYKNCPECKPAPSLIYDLTGQRFGRLLVLERAENHIQKNGSMKVQYRCLCDCGNECIVQSTHLRSYHTTSCGCLQRENTGKSKLKDITGKRYGRLVAKERVYVDNQPYWKCICDCGKERLATVRDLNAGKVTSCGCLVSVAEDKMTSYFLENNIPFVQQYRFEDCKDIRCLPFDFAVLDGEKVKLLVELQGEQHYYPFTFCGESKAIKNKNLEDRIRKDKIKQEYCEKHLIPLLRIKYTQFNKIGEIFEAFYGSLKQ